MTIINSQRYAFFDVDTELVDYCVNNLPNEYSYTSLKNSADIDGNYFIRLSHTGKFVFAKPTSNTRMRKSLPKEEFYNILLISDEKAREEYITQLYQELNQCQIDT